MAIPERTPAENDTDFIKSSNPDDSACAAGDYRGAVGHLPSSSPSRIGSVLLHVMLSGRSLREVLAKLNSRV